LITTRHPASALFLVAIVFCSAISEAQVPSQFEGLLTATTDYTCAGDVPCPTWPMPSMPAAGSGYADPTWGTTTYRLAPPAASSGQPFVVGSEVQEWNSNNTKMFLADGPSGSNLDLYDATTTPPTPINRITTTDGTWLDGVSCDALWAYTDPNRIYYVPCFTGNGTGLQLRYVDVSKCTKRDCTLKPVTVHTFSCVSDQYTSISGSGLNYAAITGFSISEKIVYFTTSSNTLRAGQTTAISGLSVGTYLNGQSLVVSSIGLSSSGFQASFTHANVGSTADSGSAGTPGNQIETGSGGGGGMFDNTDTQFSFSCDLGNGRYEIDLIRYNRSTDTVTTQAKWYNVCPGATPSGCAIWSHQNRALYRMHQSPDANYTILTWQTATCNNSTWTRGSGTEVFSPTYTFLGPASACWAHQDLGFDVNGVPVFVEVGGSVPSYPPDARAIEVTNLSTLSTTAVTSKLILLPCNYSRSGPGCERGTQLAAKSDATHISMNGSQGAFQGYALVSTMTLSGKNGAYNVDFPPATTLGTAVGGPGTYTVSPASMSNIGVGVVSVIDHNTANAESVTWSAVTSTTATATFAKAHLSTAAVSCVSCGDIGFGAMENFAVKIDATAANESNAIFYRIGRTMSIRDANYFAEPHTTANRNFTQITWEGNWNVDGGRVYEFWTKLPTAAPKASDASASPRAKPD